MNKDLTRQIVNAVALAAMLAVNILANALPLNGQTTGAISDRFEVYFVPAGYVFSIWGLIYLALTAFVVYQALPAQRENPYLRRIGYLFALSCLANIAWIFLWHYEVFISTLAAMIALLLLLIAIYLRLEIGRTRVSPIFKWLVHTPFSIYLGWITVATIANITTVLAYVKWGGFGLDPQIWAVILLIASAGIAAAIGVTRGDIAYMLVILWALAGIAIKHNNASAVAVTAWMTTEATAIFAVVTALLWDQKPKPADQENPV